MTIKMIEYPTDSEWIAVKQRALLTVGKDSCEIPDVQWRHKILEARHSPIRFLRFSFLITGIPYWVACELRTHVHDMPYVADFGVYIKSSRNDRQGEFDRNAARQDYPVNMIMDINGEQIQILANKRLCKLATEEARNVVAKMCEMVQVMCPEYDGLLVPMCVHCGGVCHEKKSCREVK